MKNIAIFASGSGTNAENLFLYFKESTDIKIPLLLTNNPQAGVIERANKFGVKVLIFNRDNFTNSDFVLNALVNEKIDFIVLAGFLWLMPIHIINRFTNRIINIHPALLPKFGGKGMYGMKVHESVISAGEVESGITIHYVNERFDEGENIFQAKVQINSDDNAESLAQKIHKLEYKYLPLVTEQLVLDLP